MKWWKIITGLLLLLLLLFILKTINKAGVFKNIQGHFDGTEVRVYDNIHGSEDIDIDHEAELLFISAGNFRNLEDGIAGIYVLDLADKDAIPTLLPSDYSGLVRPHGISVVKDQGKTILFVINHLADKDLIEKFEYSEGRLIHLNSFEHPELNNPNDMVALSADRYYVSNDHGSASGSIMATLEEYLQLPLSNIVYCESGDCKKVWTGLQMANGINVSHDHKNIYVTHTLGQELLSFDRSEANGELSLINKQSLGSGLDNIDVDQDGNLWIGSHPKMFSFVAHATDAEKIAPSQVFKVDVSDPTNYSVEEVFLDDGSTISASSVAAVHGSEIFIGVVLDNALYRGSLSK